MQFNDAIQRIRRRKLIQSWTEVLLIYGIHHGNQHQALVVKLARKLALINKSLPIETAEVQTQTKNHK